MTVPVIIVPVLNRPDLLEKMLASIDYPVGRTVIIDNGGVVPAHIEAIHLPWNVGVAAAWNLGVKVTPCAPWWLICNSDIEFGEGDLAAMVEVMADPSPRVGMMLGFTAFAVNQATIKQLGFFEEGLVPAYFEDNDYSRRCEIAGVPRVQSQWSGRHEGSATIRSAPEYNLQNGYTFSYNAQFYRQKWGGLPDHERFTTPFDRGGPITDITMDIDRYRELAWKRVP